MNVEQNTGNLARLSPEEAAQRENDRIKWLAEAQAQAQKLVKSNSAVDDYLAKFQPNNVPVEDQQPERPVAVLSLAKSVEYGLLLTDPDLLPGQDELPVDDVLWLEHPTDTELREALAAFLQLAVRKKPKDGGLAARFHTLTVMGESGYLSDVELIQREAYRQWRAQCPASLLSELTQVHLWLGEQPNPLPVSVSEIPPEPVTLGGGNPAFSRKCVADKVSFIKAAIWRGNQTNTVNQHPQAAYFKGDYLEDALLQWAGELDPRPRDKRGGRPRKT